jgi:5-methylthioribose kinase
MSEPLDIEQPDALLRYLRETGRIHPDEQPQFRFLAGGVSNRTVLVHVSDSKSWVLKQALARLRVKVDWFSDPRRIEREALGIRWLAQLAPPGTITPLIFEDPHHHLLAMAAVPQPHENWKTLLLAGELRMDHVDQFARLLGTIHREGYLQRDQFAQIFDERSFFESLRLEPYYAYAAAQVPAAGEFLHRLIADTRAIRQSIVHGDYSPKNVLIHNDRLVLLDHEVIHFGDGAFDLGFALTHLLSKAHHLRPHRAAFAAAAQRFWKTYRSALGDVPWALDTEPRTVRHTLACLLARVDGRSLLEYLDDTQRTRQREVVLALMASRPISVPQLIERFVSDIDRIENAAHARN